MAGVGGQKISTDGSNWTNGSGPGQSYAWNGTLWVGGQDSQLRYSYDGITWSNGTGAVVGLSNAGFRSIAWGKDKFIAPTRNSAAATTAGYLYSYDGINWINGGFPLGTGASINDAVYGGGQWVIGGASGTSNIATSPDGITWTLRNYNSSQSVFALGWNGLLWMAVTNNGSNCIITSPDGINWTQRTLGFSNTDGARSVTWNGSHWYVLSLNFGSNRVVRSAIGTSNWSVVAVIGTATNSGFIASRWRPRDEKRVASLYLPSFLSSDACNNRLGIGVPAPSSALDISGTVNVRGPLLARLPVTEVSGTSLTLDSSNYNRTFYLTNSGFNAATLPSSTAISDDGSFWSLRNATNTSLSITLTNTLNLTSPLVIPPANTQTLVISGVTSNTILLL
jgi:hypothetical protein